MTDPCYFHLPEVIIDNIMEHILVTPPVSIKAPVLLTVKMDLINMDSRENAIVYLDIYTASALGIIQSKLLRENLYDTNETNIANKFCLPIGNYRLAFLVYGVDFNIDIFVKLQDIKITEVSCSVDNSQMLGEK